MAGNRVLGNGMKSSWCPVISGVPQGSALGPVLFSVNDLGEGIKMPSVSLQYTKLGGSVDVIESRKAFQSHLEGWAKANGLSFIKAEC